MMAVSIKQAENLIISMGTRFLKRALVSCLQMEVFTIVTLISLLIKRTEINGLPASRQITDVRELALCMASGFEAAR